MGIHRPGKVGKLEWGACNQAADVKSRKQSWPSSSSLWRYSVWLRLSKRVFFSLSSKKTKISHSAAWSSVPPPRQKEKRDPACSGVSPLQPKELRQLWTHLNILLSFIFQQAGLGWSLLSSVCPKKQPFYKSFHKHVICIASKSPLV